MAKLAEMEEEMKATVKLWVDHSTHDEIVDAIVRDRA